MNEIFNVIIIIENKCKVSSDLESMRKLSEYQILLNFKKDVIIPILIEKLNESFMWRTALRDVVNKNIDSGENYIKTKEEWNKWYKEIYIKNSL